MATSTSLRLRRTAAQLHALASVERVIRACDRSSQRKYLSEFNESFRSYQSVLGLEQFQSLLKNSDIIAVGDYHALPASQLFTASLLETLANSGDRPVVLAVETIFARDQRIVEEWWRREIDERELRRRIRFDVDWGYDWEPFYALLVTAREHGEAIYGLDCMPREDLRKIGARDRHASHKIAEIRRQHPDALIVVLFGESHLAPGHLPLLLREQLPQERVLTLLQNIDALYWQAAGEEQEAEAVRITDDVVCVFNATPLEKYESYRLHLSRWSRGSGAGADLAPTIYNLINSLAKFLGMDRYSSHNGTQPKFLVDLLPEVCSAERSIASLLAGKQVEKDEIAFLQQKLEEQGSIYLSQINSFYIAEFRINHAAEEAARFLFHACHGLPALRSSFANLVLQPSDHFYAHVIEEALSSLGARVLDPAKRSLDTPGTSKLSVTNLRRAAESSGGGRKTAIELGRLLGDRLHNHFVEGRFSRAALRRLFLIHLEEPGAALQMCRNLIKNPVCPNRQGPSL
ncbi:MAG TPA: ChaN family lipoprotein [Terriglobales bacterium]|nr:ChaN family lipoprotein [Terriglobales bacterium]